MTRQNVNAYRDFMSFRIRLFALTAGIALSSALQAQTTAPSRTNVDSCTDVGINADLFGRLIDRQFVGLVGSSQSVPGTFGALEIDKDQKATLSTSAQPGAGRVLTFAASGGVDDGVLAFINNRESSSTFSAGVRLDFLGGPPDTGQMDWRGGGIRKNKLQYDVASCRAYLAAGRKATADADERVARIDAGALALAKRLDVARESHRLDSLAYVLGKLPALIQARIDSISATTSDSLRRQLRLRLQLDTIKQDSLPFDIATTRARKAQAERRSDPPVSVQTSESADKLASERQVAEQLLKVVGFRLGWVSVGFSVDNVTFKLFDPTAVFASQVTSKSFATPKLVLAYSEYSLDASSEKTYYWSAGLHASLTDNLSELDKVELTETKQYGPTAGERVSTKKVTARQGTYESGLAAAGASFDIYRFIGRDNDGAWHLFPAVELRAHFRPAYAAGVGFLWVARKKGEGFLNAELFYALNDIAESEASPDNVWERSQVGLRLSFPINFSPR